MMVMPKNNFEPIFKDSTHILWVMHALVLLLSVPYLPIPIILFCCGIVVFKKLFKQSANTYGKIKSEFLVIILGLSIANLLLEDRLLSFMGIASVLLILQSVMMCFMEYKNEGYTIVVITLSIVASSLFISHSPIDAFFACLIFIIALSALNALSYIDTVHASALLSAIKIGFQALPIMVCMFLFFPRTGADLSSEARTGIPPVFQIGSIAQLTESEDLVYHINFTEELDEKVFQEGIYWRTLVYSEFKQGSWLPDDWQKDGRRVKRGEEIVPASGREIDYQVIIENTDSDNIPVWGVPISSSKDLFVSSAYDLKTDSQGKSVKRFWIKSSLDAKFDLNLSEEEYAKYTSLDTKLNPKAKTFAKRLYRQSNEDSNIFLQKLLSYFYEKEFYYSLNPGVYQERNAIDVFLFDRKKGFCSHYANALAFMLRAAGVPARVVAGYKKDFTGDIDNLRLIQVFQKDAHAWVEVWKQGVGWEKVDPTTYIHPSRVKLYSYIWEGFTEEIKQLMSERMINLTYDFANNMHNHWKNWILSYGYDRKEPAEIFFDVLWFLCIFVTIILLLHLSLIYASPVHQQKIITYEYRAFCRKMERMKAGYVPGQTPRVFLSMIMQKVGFSEKKQKQLINDVNSILFEGKYGRMVILRVKYQLLLLRIMYSLHLITNWRSKHG